MHVRIHIKSLQSCLILCDPVDCSPAGSSVLEILQARILQWSYKIVCVCVCVCACMCACVRACVCKIVCACMCSVMSDSLRLWAITCQATLSIRFSSQEYWSGMPFLPKRKHTLRKSVPTSLTASLNTDSILSRLPQIKAAQTLELTH